MVPKNNVPKHNVPKNNHADQYKSQFEDITSTIRISAILAQFKNASSLLSISLPNSNSHYESKLVEISPNEKFIALSALESASAHKSLIKECNARISASLNGSEVSFSTILIKAVKGPKLYHFSFPEQVKYFQRRSEYRVHLNASIGATVNLTDAEGAQHSGTVRDLSPTGMRILVEQTDLPEFATTRELSQCTLMLPGNPAIPCRLEIRYFDNNSRTGNCLLGVCFLDLELGHSRLIERFIASVERKALREAYVRS